MWINAPILLVLAIELDRCNLIPSDRPTIVEYNFITQPQLGNRLWTHPRHNGGKKKNI